MRYRRTAADYAFDGANGLLMAAVAIITLYPFYYILIGSVSPAADVLGGKGLLWPREFHFEAYEAIFSNPLIPGAYRVTLFITLVGTLISLVLTTLGAYVLSKKYLPGRVGLTFFVVVTMLFNGGLIPFYLTVKAIGLLNTVWALIIPTCLSSFNLIIMRNFFMTIPLSLEESALIDGCSHMKLLTGIVLPVSLPVVATIVLFYAVGYWNAFFYATLFITSDALKPVQVLLREMLVLGRTDLAFRDESYVPPVETTKMALVIIVVAPIVLIYPFLQKYFVKGLLMGSVKG